MKGRATSKPCRTHGCPEVRPCPVEGHEPKPWGSSDRRSRLPKDWNRRVRYIRRRDPICTHPGCDRPTEEVDHIINNDDHSYTNLQGLCRPHHQAKTLREAAEGRKK